MNILRLFLKEYNLIEAVTAAQALRFFFDNYQRIDLLLADLTLPASSGLKVALRCRETLPALPILLTSGYPVKSWGSCDIADLDTIGSNSVTILEKPFQPGALADAVRRLIGQSENVRTA